MARTKEIRDRRDEKIKKKFLKLKSVKIGDAQLYTRTAILEKLSTEFFLSKGTLRNVLRKKNLPITKTTK